MILFLTPKEIAATTMVGGNVERDKYTPCIENIQITVIEPMLGTLLYDKIISDLENNTLTGDYLTLFNDYIKPITKNFSVAEYALISTLNWTNKGIQVQNSENTNAASKERLNDVASLYKSTAQSHVIRFEKWIKENTLIEYVKHQEEVNPQEIKRSFNWYI